MVGINGYINQQFKRPEFSVPLYETLDIGGGSITLRGIGRVAQGFIINWIKGITETPNGITVTDSLNQTIIRNTSTGVVQIFAISQANIIVIGSEYTLTSNASINIQYQIIWENYNND